jgi:hypothetical protein
MPSCSCEASTLRCKTTCSNVVGPCELQIQNVCWDQQQYSQTSIIGSTSGIGNKSATVSPWCSSCQQLRWLWRQLRRRWLLQQLVRPKPPTASQQHMLSWMMMETMTQKRAGDGGCGPCWLHPHQLLHPAAPARSPDVRCKLRSTGKCSHPAAASIMIIQ